MGRTFKDIRNIICLKYYEPKKAAIENDVCVSNRQRTLTQKKSNGYKSGNFSGHLLIGYIHIDSLDQVPMSS